MAAWLASRGEPATGTTRFRPRRRRPTDPRRTYAGPYRNIGPEVRYVGDAQCVGCHEDVADSFALHPMARSLVPVADLLDRQRYSQDVNNPFTALGRRFQVDRQGNAVWHRQAVLDDSGKPIVELAQEVRWAIGSGAKGYSYLTRTRRLPAADADQLVHGQKQRWDLSPGFGPSVLAGASVPASCLFCHANRVREDPEHPDRFEQPVFEGSAIGCERCHGPGELHVRGAADNTIVNPADLAPLLRDAVCEQCHLEGEGANPSRGPGPVRLSARLAPVRLLGGAGAGAAERRRRQGGHPRRADGSEQVLSAAGRARCSWVASPATTRTFGSGRRSGKPIIAARA